MNKTRVNARNFGCLRVAALGDNLCFRRMRTFQKFVAVYSSVHDHFNAERHLYSRNDFKLNRATALNEWSQLCSA